MAKTVTKRKTSKKLSTREELELLDKSNLIDRILQLEARNVQLKSHINKDAVHVDEKVKNVKRRHKPFNFIQCHKRHILLKFYYLGWDYNGFTTQEDTTNTIEHHLFAALTKSCCIESRASANYHRCGRTDKGVSAFSQVVSLDIRSRLEPENQNDLQNELPYCKLLNRLLPQNIRCIAWCPVPSDFSARFNCVFRTYKYSFPRGNLNIEAMDKAVKLTIGSHDFRNICKMDVGNGVVKFDRTITEARVYVKKCETDVPSGYDMCELEITSQAFLWHQIRCLMGVLLLVGQEKEKPEVISELLDTKSYPCKPQYSLAHEVPLSLFHCQYDGVDWFIDQNELAYTIKTLQKDWTINSVKSTMIRTMLSDLERHIVTDEIKSQSDCLTNGAQSKVYQPLMKRVTCNSLESKIQHYAKKQKIEVTDSNVT